MKWFIDDVHKAYRYLSVQLAALLALAATAWEYLPQFQQYLDPAWVKYFALAILVSRVIKQTPTVAEADKAPAGNDADPS